MCRRLMIFGISVPSYGLMILLGMFTVTVSGAMTARRRGLPVSRFFLLTLCGGASAAAGAKLLYMFEHGGTDGISPAAFLHSGYSAYGGILSGALAVYGIAKIMGLDVRIWAGELLFFVPFFHAFWKMGCFLGGCCYGIPYQGPGAVTFPGNVPAPEGMPLFPVQLLEMAVLLLLAAVCFRRRSCPFRHPIACYIGMYADSRFLTEFFRYHPDGAVLSAAQKISLACCLVVGIYYYLQMKRPEHGNRKTRI